MTRHCDVGPADLGPLLLGALPPAEHRRVEDHLAVCPGCRAEAAELRPVVGLMADAAATVELDGRGADQPALQDGALERLLAAANGRAAQIERDVIVGRHFLRESDRRIRQRLASLHDHDDKLTTAAAQAVLERPG